VGTLTSGLRLAVGFFLFLLLSFLAALAALPLLPWRVRRIKLCNLYGKLLGRSIVWLAGVTPRIADRGRIDASMPAIYIANHTSTLDLFLSIWLCPYGACGVMKKELARVPVFGLLAILSGHLLIDRGNRERAVEALRTTAELMKAHRLGVWIMPEGTRSKTGRLLPFKLGFVHLAIATGFPIVPIVYHGVHHSWTKGSWMLRPMDLDIEVLAPIDTSGWREEEAAQRAQEVHDLFVGVLREDQRPLPAA
jgi:1-acyl-sn-glycerol-3-phosphate acyltransferase